MSKEFDILVIDDEQVILDAVVKIASLGNYTVDTAFSIKNASEKILKNSYPIILCDIMMPDGDGFQILSEVRKRYPDSVVLMMTGYSTVENAVNSLYQGALDFIPKPFTVDELLSTIWRAKKYLEIKLRQKQSQQSKHQVQLFYVDCPAKYFRLGNSSWLFQERDGSVLVGVCDLFLKTINSVTELILLDAEEEIAQGIKCVTLKSEEGRIHEVLSPISGRIIKVNQNLKTNYSLIEKDPYFEGWVYRVIPSDVEFDVKNLVPCSSDRT